MKTIFHCPCCSWAHEEPELKTEVTDPMSLAGVFGFGVFAAVAISQRNQRIEQTLADHFATHKPLDWIRRIVELEGQLRLERALTSKQGERLYDLLTEGKAPGPAISQPAPSSASDSPPPLRDDPVLSPNQYWKEELERSP